MEKGIVSRSRLPPPLTGLRYTCDKPRFVYNEGEETAMTPNETEPLPLEVSAYQATDLAEICSLFYETVHTVNARDYTPEQLSVWAPREADTERWHRTLLAHRAYVARTEGTLVGFGDIADDGYLDRLYVHKDYQRRGIATALCRILENSVSAPRLTVHASITARAFFETRGYTVVARQQIILRGTPLTNFAMQKLRHPH